MKKYDKQLVEEYAQEKDPEYGYCSTCSCYGKAYICSSCNDASEYVFDAAGYIEEHGEELEKELDAFSGKEADYAEDRNFFGFFLSHDFPLNHPDEILRDYKNLKEWRSTEGGNKFIELFDKSQMDRIKDMYAQYILSGNMKMLITCDTPSLAKKEMRNVPVLFYQGKDPDFECRTVAIAGSRQATNYGLGTTEFTAGSLADFAGMKIITGNAVGIATAALKGAIGSGNAVVVFASGLDQDYPRENKDLYDRLRNGEGTILSPFPPGTPPMSKHFLKQGEVMTSLADVFLIPEAREKSGVMVKANLALEKGKALFAIPGRITDPMSKGCNALIYQGAAEIATCPQDIIDYLEGGE